MIRKIMMCLVTTLMFFISNDVVSGAEEHMVEVFDVNNNEEIISILSNEVIQNDVRVILEGIDGVVQKLNPIPDNGFIVKIPLEPNMMLENEWINDLVNEVIIFYSEKEYPYLLIFNDENNPYFFTFKGDAVDLLLKIH